MIKTCGNCGWRLLRYGCVQPDRILSLGTKSTLAIIVTPVAKACRHWEEKK